MGTLDQVIERLDETEKQAGEVVRQLEEAESLHTSLAETRKGLEAVARDVKKLVTVTRKGVNALSEAITAFKTATETIQRSDPGMITTALKAMETRIEAIAGEVSAIDEIKAEVAGLKATVAQTASESAERTRAIPGMITTALKAMETRIEAIAGEVSAIDEIKAEVAGLKATVAQTASESAERTRAIPGMITTALKAMETRIEAIVGEVSAIDEIKAEVAGLKATVAQTASESAERTRAMIDNAVDEVSGQSLIDRMFGQRRSAKAKQNPSR